MTHTPQYLHRLQRVVELDRLSGLGWWEFLDCASPYVENAEHIHTCSETRIDYDCYFVPLVAARSAIAMYSAW